VSLIANLVDDFSARYSDPNAYLVHYCTNIMFQYEFSIRVVWPNIALHLTALLEYLDLLMLLPRTTSKRLTINL